MDDTLYMKRCFELAQRGKGYTAPNPMVGAILVHRERILSEGWHHEYGNHHAEVDCIHKVADEDKHLIKESTLYVNLEPCAHYGNTPPCAERIVQEGIKKVVIANNDPFEQVNGKGMEILRQAGTVVTTGLCAAEGAWLNRRFFCRYQHHRPYIILKWAQTADGYIAPADKSRFTITNNHSRQLLHKWRTEEGAIMVGSTTAINDNPQLTSRLWKGKQPVRIVLDRKLILPARRNIFDDTAPTWIVNEQMEKTLGNIRFVQLDFDHSLLHALMLQLYDSKVLSVIIEGGAKLLHSFIDSGLWDEARVFTGTVPLRDGIAAPLLKDSNKILTTAIDNDTLNVWVHENSPYPYINGMML